MEHRQAASRTPDRPHAVGVIAGPMPNGRGCIFTLPTGLPERPSYRIGSFEDSCTQLRPHEVVTELHEHTSEHILAHAVGIDPPVVVALDGQ